MKSIELNVSLFVPPHNPASVLIAELAEVIRNRSNGRLLLRISHGEGLGTTAAQYDLAASGAVDIAYFIHSATPGRFPLTEFATLPPVVDAITATVSLQRLSSSYLASEYAEVKLLFLTANTPMAIHAAVPVRSLGDFKGLRIGHTGRVVAATLEALGASPIKIPPLQIRAALAGGLIDASSMTYEAALVLRLADLTRFSYELNAYTITFGLAMTLQRYLTLTPELQILVDEVLGASAGMQLAQSLTEAAGEGRHYMRDAGVVLVAPGKDDKLMLDRIAKSVTAAFVTELGKQNLPARNVIDALKNSVEH